MGVQLYKDEYLCIRELYQNSLDATKCIIAVNKQNGVQENLSIEFGIGEEVVEMPVKKRRFMMGNALVVNLIEQMEPLLSKIFENEE